MIIDPLGQKAEPLQETRKATTHANPSVMQYQDGLKLVTVFEPGLTKREWFAGMVLLVLDEHQTRNMTENEIADWAYKRADAMLARGKTDAP